MYNIDLLSLAKAPGRGCSGQGNVWKIPFLRAAQQHALQPPWGKDKSTLSLPPISILSNVKQKPPFINMYYISASLIHLLSLLYVSLSVPQHWCLIITQSTKHFQGVVMSSVNSLTSKRSNLGTKYQHAHWTLPLGVPFTVSGFQTQLGQRNTSSFLLSHPSA